MVKKTIDIFHKIEYPDEIVTNLLFNACTQLNTKETLNLIKEVSSKMPKSYYFNCYLLTSLLSALMKFGDIEYAQILFENSTNKTLSMPM